MMLFDSHCHLDDPAFKDDLDALVVRARAAGVARMMTVGVTLETSRRAIAIAESRPGVCASVGVHPHDAQECSDDVLDELVRLSGSPEVRAWGETGLDFNRMHSPRDEQEKWFVRQLEAASERSLPMIFHERDSQGRFLELLQTCPPPPGAAVVHCFSGTRPELTRYLDYCSEMLALLSKLAALHTQHFNDPVTLEAVNDVENLTQGLARTI